MLLHATSCAVHVLQAATLGDFVFRLDLLRTVMQYLTLVHVQATLASPASAASQPNRTNAADVRSIVVLLANMTSYYAQFEPAVVAKLKEHRSPLEKKIDDFVKLSKWDEQNYVSLKLSVEKSHRELAKVFVPPLAANSYHPW